MREITDETDRKEAGETDAAGAEAARFRSSPFYAALHRALARRRIDPRHVCDAETAVGRRLLTEYGAMFLAADSVRVPPACVFASEEEVERFQREVEPRASLFGGVEIELQPAAMDALLAVRDDARAAGFDVTPRGGAEAARRGYADTVRLWDSRVRPAVEHWLGCERLAAEEAERLRALAPEEQLADVLAHEACGVYFSKDFSKSILQSVAAPGASQHLALVAFDAEEFCEPAVRAAFARHGWFQTVLSDLPHFTFLGVREKELPALGLRRVEECGQQFWVPDVG